MAKARKPSGKKGKVFVEEKVGLPSVRQLQHDQTTRRLTGMLLLTPWRLRARCWI